MGLKFESPASFQNSAPVHTNGDFFKQPLQPVGSWSETARRVLEERYLVKLGGETAETPDEMCWRVALDIARAEDAWEPPEEIYKVACDFYGILVEKQFLPNSPTLMNAGRNNGLQYSACYVLPIEDSLDKIFEAIRNAAIIHQSGGGTGFSFSRLRPKDSLVKRSHGKASGPVSFLRVFDAATEAVKQGGKRRGANMGILRVDHPDILEFIQCKRDGGITNFNISVGLTEVFMNAYERNLEYDLVAPHTGETLGKLKAREVLDIMCETAWQTGDPGCIFVDRINQGPANPVPALGPIEATNPCGEQPLYPNEACNLGSINLSKFALAPHCEDRFNWQELERVVRLAVRFLDDVIEKNPYPLPEIDSNVKANRRIGLGVMGWADLLYRLRIPYHSDKALSLARRIMGVLRDTGHDESAKLASVRGAFSNFSKSIYREGRPLRNATVTTIAPTGSISIIGDCSSGIEPFFALAFSHRVGDRKLDFVNPWLVEALEEQGLWNDAVKKEVLERGEIGELDRVPKPIRDCFVTAHEVPPDWHVRMQAAFQESTDNAVSKTVNLPHDATVEDVKKIYLQAYQTGCAGTTIFRDGCKDTQVLHRGISEKEKSVEADVRQTSFSIKSRPRQLTGITVRENSPSGPCYVTLNSDEQKELFEIFVNVGKAGSDIQADSEALGRLISLILRIPSPWSARTRVEEIVKQLRDIGGRRDYGFGPARVRSVPDAVGKVLAEHALEEPLMGASQKGLNGGGEKSMTEPPQTQSEAFVNSAEPAVKSNAKSRVQADLCPECGSTSLVFQEGCAKCHDCGFSNC